MKWLSNYAHERKVRIGVYFDYGAKTCGGFTGSEGYLWKDAYTLARWEMDMIKVDACNSACDVKGDGYHEFAHFLNATGRPILYLHEWTMACRSTVPWEELWESGNAWRTGHDIAAKWSNVLSIINDYGNNPQWAKYARPGGWNDPDMIMVGCSRNGLNQPESRTSMAIWSIVAAPLMMSNDLRKLQQWQKDILMNKEAVAVDQDVLGKPGTRVTGQFEDAQVWVRELEKGDFAVGLMNRADSAQKITVKFTQVSPTVKKFKIRDIWAKKDLGTFENEYTAQSVEAHDTHFLRLTPA
jgi:hypothetical protein